MPGLGDDLSKRRRKPTTKRTRKPKGTGKRYPDRDQRTTTDDPRVERLARGGRLLLVLLQAGQPLSLPEAAQLAGIGYRTALRWLNAWRAAGVPIEEHGVGNKRTYSASMPSMEDLEL